MQCGLNYLTDVMPLLERDHYVSCGTEKGITEKNISFTFYMYFWSDPLLPCLHVVVLIVALTMLTMT